MKRNMKWSYVTIFLTGFILVYVFSNLRLGKDHWKSILGADAKGYYSYLPAVFIYQDLNFGFFDKIEKEKYYNPNLYYDYRSGSSNGKVINKYYCGTALVELPFFLMAHSFSIIFNYDLDGYSKLYLVFISVAAIFYLLAGLLYLNATLNYYGLSEFQKSIVIVAAVFGTNLFYYTVIESGMSHVFSFAFISAFIYYVKVYFKDLDKKNVIYLLLLLAVIVLIRPINGLIVLVIPFLSSNYKVLRKGVLQLLTYQKQLLIGLLLFISIISIQLIIYKVSTGNFLVYSYLDEKFNFLSPHIFDFLFSYRKGLFLYTPMYLLSLSGFYFLWKSNKFEFYSLLLFLFLITYIFSSWWMWYYGGSFSTRVFVEYIPLFAILLGIAIQRIKRFINVFKVVVLMLIVLCQIQTYQYRYQQIHWSDMTKEKYWDVFLRVDRLID